MTSVVSTPPLTPHEMYPACTDPGYVMTLSLGGSDYQVFAYIEETHGTKTYLPSNCDSQIFEKIRSLTWGLLNAHDAFRTSLDEAPYEMKTLDAKGLYTADDRVISHDFLIQPVSSDVADQMASAISLAGRPPMQASAIKAQDIWTTIEGIIRRTMKRSTTPAKLTTSTNAPNANPPPPSSTPPTNPIPSPEIPPASQRQRANQISDPTSNAPIPNPTPTSMTFPPYRAPITATDLDLREFNFEQTDWYELIPIRTKLRIITDILEFRCPSGGIYAKVWNLFETKICNDDPPSNIIKLLNEEQSKLVNLCRTLPSTIPLPIRYQASQVIKAFYTRFTEKEMQDKILSLMEKEFNGKEQLFRRIREQAEAEGIVIEDWDHKWVEYYFIENTHRFVQVLTRWLDND